MPSDSPNPLLLLHSLSCSLPMTLSQVRSARPDQPDQIAWPLKGPHIPSLCPSNLTPPPRRPHYATAALPASPRHGWK
uniref:Secreted protein n=1 Tax=Knipowitschia caucasica TaxID=637954 RepID=A0AAV2KS26_KNICA